MTKDFCKQFIDERRCDSSQIDTCLTCFLLKFLEDIIPFRGALTPLFWTFGDVYPGFQSQGGFFACTLSYLHAIPQIHLWCDPCWLYRGQHGSRVYWSMYLQTCLQALVEVRASDLSNKEYLNLNTISQQQQWWHIKYCLRRLYRFCRLSFHSCYLWKPMMSKLRGVSELQGFRDLTERVQDKHLIWQ